MKYMLKKNKRLKRKIMQKRKLRNHKKQNIIKTLMYMKAFFFLLLKELSNEVHHYHIT
jgi:hypothetical protein